MNSSFTHDNICKIIHKKRHPKCYHIGIKCHISVDLEIGSLHAFGVTSTFTFPIPSLCNTVTLHRYTYLWTYLQLVFFYVSLPTYHKIHLTYYTCNLPLCNYLPNCYWSMTQLRYSLICSNFLSPWWNAITHTSCVILNTRAFSTTRS